MGYKIMAALILTVFYGIYALKLYVQKRQGITAAVLGMGEKKREVMLAERLAGGACLAALLAEILSIILVPADTLGGLRFLGMVIAIGGTIVFALAVSTMNSNWRVGIPEGEKASLVTDGIYSLSRNPAFSGFDLVYLGIMLMFFNLPLMFVSALAAIALHLQAIQEERYLTGVFGVEYLAYRNRVMRYAGRHRNVHMRSKLKR